MNQPALPAYLQNRQTRKLTEDATAGLGTSRPAHISTEGSVFTLVDAAGNSRRLTLTAQDGREYQQPYLDANVLDLSASVSKRYYEEPYQKDAGMPPTCFSANGVVPSRESMRQQARTCAECSHNVRGSATSELSGAAIKACRDEKWLAVTIPQTSMDTIFRFVITPGSFKNWKAYTEAFKGGPVDISDVLTRFEWVGPDAPNVIKFSATAYIDERTAQLAERALAAKATDAIVGRDDKAPQLAAPAPQAAIAQTTPLASAPPLSNAPLAGQQSMPMGTFSPNPSPSAHAPAPTGTAEPPAPGRRRRNAAPQAASAQGQAPLHAPFPVSAPPGNRAGVGMAPGTPGGGPTFGIQPGVAPDPALSATLANLFPGNKQ